MLNMEAYREQNQDRMAETGTYVLAIARRSNDGDIEVNNPFSYGWEEFVFNPNPTDIDVDMQIPNVVHPDQFDGYYVNVNRIGTKTISISGTTGQRPSKEGMFNDITNALFGPMGGQVQALRDLIPGQAPQTGYTVMMKLINFFVKWFEKIKSNPNAWAMLWLNPKDGEFFHVVPMSFRKPRTASRPLHYQYAIQLRVLGEVNYRGRHGRRGWLDRMSEIRGEITKWKNAVNNIILLASALTRAVVRPVFAPLYDISNTLNNMTAGLQSMVATGEMISGMGRSSTQSIVDAARALNNFNDKPQFNDNFVSGLISQSVLHRSVPLLTRTGIASVLSPIPGILNTAVEHLAISAPANIRGHITPDDPYIEQYGMALDMMFEAYVAMDRAPIPDYEPANDVDSMSRVMHEAARSGNTAYIDGQENEYTSTVLAAETDYRGTDTRHPAGINRSIEQVPLSYLASMILTTLQPSQREAVSAEIESFRRAFLGMRDPTTLSPLYREIKVTVTDTVYSLADTHLGDWRRWSEIALINNLEYPYVSPDGGESCATPGDTIYVPVPGAKVPIETIAQYKNIVRIHDKLSLQDVFLGFDIEIQGTGDTKFWKNDLSHVSGVKAFEQEMAIVMEGAGGITSDRIAGPRLRIGTKGKGVASLAMWRGMLRSWLSGDPRVEAVEWINVYQKGDQVGYSVRLRFEQYDSSITLAGALRN